MENWTSRKTAVMLLSVLAVADYLAAADVLLGEQAFSEDSSLIAKCYK